MGPDWKRGVTNLARMSSLNGRKRRRPCVSFALGWTERGISKQRRHVASHCDDGHETLTRKHERLQIAGGYRIMRLALLLMASTILCAQTPYVNIDNPAPNAAVSGTVSMIGWTLDNTSVIGTAINPGSLVVSLDGVLVGTATYGMYRSDVCAAFPGRPGCPNVGFT